MPGTLHIVSTPIGNLGDMTMRAIETLRSVALILAEDTRHSRPLLAHFDIHTPMMAFHEHNEAGATPGVVARLLAGESVALITDAGTPLVSDPGARLVRAATDAGVQVSPVPGASALLAALVVAGIPADRFTFLGFLARKGRERHDSIDAIRDATSTIVIYEAPGRVAGTLGDLAAAGVADREVVVARELTKQFEEIKRGTAAELALYYDDHAPRGEVVIVVAGAESAPVDEDALRSRAEELLGTGASARDVARVLVEQLGAPRNLAYRLAHRLDL
jgi:16S rRNA (cytidine1402-2'-O)-methyltransferase